MLKKSSIVAFGLILLIAAVLLAEGESWPTVEELRKGRLRGSPTAAVWTGEQARPDTPAPASPAATFTVNTTADAGPGSLRQAILNANANAGHDVIQFNIAPAGVLHTIFPLTPLPWLLDNAGVTIDGLSQPGGATQGASPPSTLNLSIEIDGINCPSVGPPGATRGLVLQSSNDTIQGLIVNNWWESGICTQGGPINEYAQFNLVRWNISGMDSTGTVCKGNGRGQTALWAGICICNAPQGEIPAFASYNTIEENLSSCNYTEGITVVGPIQPGDVHNNFVLGNYVGTDITGTLDRGNVHEGICLCEGTHHNLVRGNLSSGNDYDGIGLQGYDNEPFPPAPPIQTHSNQIDSNTVGLDVNGNPLPNTYAGITVGEYGPSQWGCADKNTIEHNTIAENGWDGVAVWEDDVNNFNADANLITQNSIYDNDSLGIDLQNDGVTPNDPNDPDTGPNEEMNFPVITSASYSGGNTTITGTLSTPNPNTATVEVFRARLDPTGNGEGERYLGSATPDAAGNWGLTDATLVPGDSVTATATDQNNNTSEFSKTFPVTTGVQFPRDHFKVWSVDQISVSLFPQVKDQFHSEYFDINVTRLDFFSNPVNKNDEGIQRPNDHLTWYKTSPLLEEREVEYQNQFESTTVSIDSLVYLLVPTEKLPHPPPDSLDHYLCYRIANPRTIIGEVKLEDQFHIEYIDSLRSKYFCAPCDKIHNEQEYIRFDSSTHYVAYEIFPKDIIDTTVETQDQFQVGSLTIWQSELLLVPTAKEEVSVVDTCEYYKPAYVDYAPAGMPDFDQKQDAWTCPATGAWSHCGPVALADCFWWFDSKFETSGTPPPTVADNYPLVQNYTGVAGVDDHDTSNVIPFVDSMAVYCNTNPPGQCGTNVFDLATGAQNWLDSVGLGGRYSIQVIPIDPGMGFEYIREQVLLSQDVILLIGFWQESGGGYCERRGGHFMTVAGVCPDPADSALCFSDPFYDLNEGDPPGPPPHNADVHNDAQYVSGPHGTMHHDKYYVIPALCTPSGGDPWVVELANYAAVPANIANFDGQNSYDPTATPAPPNGMPVHTLLEFVVVICPVEVPPEPTPGKIKHNIDGYEPGDGSPIGTDWHELWPDYCEYWTCSSWVDNGDGVLSQCDTIDFVHIPTGRKIWEHVEKVTPTITVTDVDDPVDTMYLDLIDPNPMCTLMTSPVGTFWHEVWPNYCTVWEIIGWTDNGNGYLDHCDNIDIETSGGGSTASVHVEAVETDIVTVPLPNPDADEYDHNIDGYHPSMGDPTGTQWHELWPVYCQWWDLAEWRDNGDGTLSFCDTIKFQSTADPDSVVWKHIEEVTLTIKAANEIDSFYFDFMCGNQNVDPITDPINTFWHEVWPTFCQRFICVGWTDNGSGYLDSCDYIDLMLISGPDSGNVAQYHVKAAETDIITIIIEMPVDTCDYYKQGYLDFCPNGMPDFDQKQDAWTSPFTGNWSWCGPLALGNCIWWFDSKFEPNPVDPRPFYPGPGNPPQNDNYPLVQSYDPGGIWDDHDTNNVMPFIQALAPMCNTDMTVPGTRLSDLEIGFQNWIATAGLAGLYSTYVIFGPEFEEIKDSILSCQDVILLLGFYELIDGGPDCQWLGGHYVTSAGVCTEETDICLSDPMFDANEGEPPAGGAHGSSVHNDASLISGPHGTYHHDRYHLQPNIYACPSPATWMFTNYPNNWADVFVFENLNPIDPMPPVTYFGGPIIVLLDAAIIICPAVPPPPEPTPGKVKHCFDTSGYRPSMGSPVGTNWHELWPNYCERWLCNSWIDNGDGVLSYCDTIDFVHVPTGRKIWEHVELVMPTIKVDINPPSDFKYLDGLDPNPMCTTITDPIGSWWHEVYPNYCVIWQITGWVDNGNGYLDFCDTVTIETPDGAEFHTGHVGEGVETDIVTTPLPTPGDEYDHNIDGYFPPDDPTGTMWHELWPFYCRNWQLTEWRDNGDGTLSFCDTIKFQSTEEPDSVIWKHIEEVTGTIKATVDVDTFYFDYMCGNPNVEPITNAIGTYWHEIWPVFSQRWVCTGWADNGNGYLDSCDWIDLMQMDGPDSGLVVSYHVEAWETDIISTYISVGPPSDTLIILDTVYGLNPSGNLPSGPDTKKFMMRWKYTTGNPVLGFVNGFRVYSPDGATWQPIVLDTVSLGWPTMFDGGQWISYNSVNGSGADTASFAAFAIMGSGIVPPYDTLVWWIETKVYPADSGKTLCVDSSYCPTRGPWIWATSTTPGGFAPNWSGPHCFEIVGCCNHDGIRGDADYDRSINVADAVLLVNYIFFGGPAPPCIEEGDADGDGSINVADVVCLVDYIFFSGPAPAPCP